MRKSPPESRFWQYVNKTERCWLWTAGTDSSGYGTFHLVGHARTSAHRFAYERLVGPIPPGLELDHLCSETRCVRPDHLEPVTGAENRRRKYARMTSCKNGHPYDDTNTYIRPGGGRDCRACIRARAAAYKRRTRMGEIGEPQREVTFEPAPETAPVEQPVAPLPVEPERVPA